MVREARSAGSVAGDGGSFGYAVAHNGSNRLITLRYRLRDLTVDAIEKEFKSGNVDFPAGSLLIRKGGRDFDRRVRRAVEELGLTAAALEREPEADSHVADLPRIAMYSTWGSTQEVGWVRHAFDAFEISYDLIYKERVRKGDLRSSYDVIVIPSQGGSAKRIVYDVEARGIPLAYTRTDKFKFLGMYGESEDITGGMGLEGLLELQRFIDRGGILVTMGSASFLPAEFGLTRNVEASRPTPQFYAPGPIVEAEVLRPEHPIFYGYSQKLLPVRYAGGPLLQVPERYRERQVLMRFPAGEKSVLSGLMRNDTEIRNRGAILDVPVGAGRVLMFATNPCYRWQNHGEFNMLFNALMHYNDIPRVDRQAPRTGFPSGRLRPGASGTGVDPIAALRQE
jgi:hypothetical protein